jgi:hypothetical protein
MYFSSYETALKRPMRETPEEYVSGAKRPLFIKQAVVDKEEDSTPIM